MKIGMLLLTKFPPDIRVEKEVLSLSKIHEIHLLCPNRGQKTNENLNSISVTRVFNNLIRWVSNLEILYLKRSIFWEFEIEKFVKKNNIQVLHVHDLPLTKSALKIAKKHNIKIVVDLHENYPAMINDFHLSSQNPFKSISNFTKSLTTYRSWKVYEEQILHMVDNIIVVIEEAKNRLIQEYSIEPNKVHVVPNYHISPNNNNFHAKDFSTKKINFLYTGGIDYTRDIDTLIISLSLLDDFYLEQIFLNIVGASSSQKAEIEKDIVKLGIKDGVVNIVEFLPFEQLNSFFQNSHIGLIPHVRSEHTSSTIPHKLFQYLHHGLPVLVSNCEPLIRIVKQAECGFVYNSKEALSLKTAIMRIIDNKDSLGLISQNAYKAENITYNWNKSESALFNLYNNLR